MSYHYTLTLDEHELLSLIQEEAAEVIQSISKIRRTGKHYKAYGKEKTNLRAFKEELLDFLLCIDLLEDRVGFFEEDADFDEERYLQEKIIRLAQHSRLNILHKERLQMYDQVR